MGSYLKPKAFSHTRLNNKKYVAMMNFVLSLLKSIDAGKLGMAALVSRFEKKMNKMTVLIVRSRALYETQMLRALDKNRINVYRQLRDVIHSFRYSVDLSQQESYFALSRIMKPYTSLPEIPQEDRSASIKSLYTDLTKPENMPHTQALHLETFVEDLNQLNIAFGKKRIERQKHRKLDSENPSKKLRQQIDSDYDDIVDRIYGASIFQSDEKLENFIHRLNAYIRETLTNKRISDGVRAYYKREEQKKEDAEESKKAAEIKDTQKTEDKPVAAEEETNEDKVAKPILRIVPKSFPELPMSSKDFTACRVP